MTRLSPLLIALSAIACFCLPPASFPQTCEDYQETIHTVDRIRLDPSFHQRVFRDCMAYVVVEVDDAPELRIYDYADPQNPVGLGSLSLPAWTFVLQGDYLFVPATDVHIVDVSDPTAPALVGVIDLPLFAEFTALACEGQTICVVYDRFQLDVVDITDSGNPQVMSTIELEDEPFDLVLAGGLLYLVADYLFIYDVSQPASPVRLGDHDIARDPINIALREGYAYVQNRQIIEVFDVSHPQSLVKTGEVTVPSEHMYNIGHTISFRGELAFVTSYSSNFTVLDLSQPGQPTVAARINLTYPASQAALCGDTAYVPVAPISEVAIVDITSIANVSPCNDGKELDTRGGEGQLLDSHLFTLGSPGFRIYDVSAPCNPVQVGSYDTPDPVCVRVKGPYAFVAESEWHRGIHVVDVTNVTAPKLVSAVEFSAPPGEFIIVGDYLYVAARYGGLLTIHISDPLDPVLISALITSSSPEHVALAGKNLAVTGNNRLALVDISDPAAPAMIGDGASVIYGLHAVAVQGNYAYVSGQNFGLAIFDISVPATPVLVGEAWALWRHEDIAVYGRYGYLNGCVLDVLDPTDPVVIGYLGFTGIFAVTPSHLFTNYWQGSPGVYLPQCGNELPYYLHAFNAVAADSSVSLSWVATELEDVFSYRLAGAWEDQAWEVPYVGEGYGSYAAIDTPSAVTEGGDVTYSLFVRRDAQPWSQLASETVSFPEPPPPPPPEYLTRITGAWPNPFNPRVTITWTLAREQNSLLTVYDLLGRRVAVLADRPGQAGPQEATWQGRDSHSRSVASGAYIVRLQTADAVECRKIVLAR